MDGTDVDEQCPVLTNFGDKVGIWSRRFATIGIVPEDIPSVWTLIRRIAQHSFHTHSCDCDQLDRMERVARSNVQDFGSFSSPTKIRVQQH